MPSVGLELATTGIAYPVERRRIVASWLPMPVAAVEPDSV
jgi:hypothetical protein